ncbi:hypothetical protein M011DRAFT_178166 [Sporormia fimetaria CBS 119925]|uniref:D-isomer specific 2-hydroxyacid dehydrogenase NAD-binding domain-containing protein n=1 Tax=Sporormia fimetaria CBS 119925 TaxID=1340428 RepID=A0A6A6VNC1_9PLEO|nr:hypothetical protein M011DRAFT_178166 [Sporormia fimetaria CBS 119925]
MAGNETPTNGTSDRQLLLAVLPWPEEDTKPLVKGLEDEFPELEVKYIYEELAKKWDKQGQLQIPEDYIKRAKILATLSWLPSSASAAPNLELIQFFSAGTNHVASHPIYTDSDIPLATQSGIHGPQIAEWVIMMDLIHSHKYIEFYEAQKRKEWDQKRGMKVKDAVGRRVGVLGYGSIGRQVARVAKAMGSDVIAYTASPRPTPESRRDNGFIVPGTGDPDGSLPSAWYSGLEKEKLHEFLRQGIDLLVVSVPLTEKTTHFLSTKEFNLLSSSSPRGCFIANISRGAIIDQAALVEALETEKIRGAALDVTDPEPLPKEDGLWDVKNCYITPHISGVSEDYAQRAFQVLRENLRRRREGRGLVNLVDRERGY